MDERNYSDAALVLLGHGTVLDQESGAVVFQHAAELRRRRAFAEVREAFWKQEPQIKTVLAGLKQRRVFIVPLFVSEGYFSDGVIPRELGFWDEAAGRVARVRVEGETKLVYCKPVGTHASVTDLLVQRAQEVLKQFPFPRPAKASEVSLFIAGHGTSQSENSRKAIERQVELIQARGLFASVGAVFLEEEPRIADCYALAATKFIVVVPFFISEGLHARGDLPVLLGEPERVVKQRLAAGQEPWRNPTERKGKLVWYARSLGTAPGLAEVILERVGEMGGE